MSGETGTFKMYTGVRGSSAFNGLQLTGGVALGVSTQVAVPWDAVTVDTDGIQGGGSFVASGVTVPAGAYGQVPAGMAGLWRISSTLDTVVTSDGGLWELDIVRENYATEFVQSVLDVATSPNEWDFIIQPLIFIATVGQRFWISFTPFGGTANIGGDASFFLMEYLGPTP